MPDDRRLVLEILYRSARLRLSNATQSRKAGCSIHNSHDDRLCKVFAHEIICCMYEGRVDWARNMALYVRPHTCLMGRLVVGILSMSAGLGLNASLNITHHLFTSRNVRSITQASGKHHWGSSTHPQDHDGDTSARSWRRHIRKIMTGIFYTSARSWQRHIRKIMTGIFYTSARSWQRSSTHLQDHNWIWHTLLLLWALQCLHHKHKLVRSHTHIMGILPSVPQFFQILSVAWLEKKTWI